MDYRENVWPKKEYFIKYTETITSEVKIEECPKEIIIESIPNVNDKLIIGNIQYLVTKRFIDGFEDNFFLTAVLEPLELVNCKYKKIFAKVAAKIEGTGKSEWKVANTFELKNDVGFLIQSKFILFIDLNINDYIKIKDANATNTENNNQIDYRLEDSYSLFKEKQKGKNGENILTVGKAEFKLSNLIS